MDIVIADDSRVMRQVVLRTLRQAGFDQHTHVEAVDGAAARGVRAGSRRDPGAGR